MIEDYALDVYTNAYSSNFDNLKKSLFTAFEISICALIFPVKTLLFTIHNYLTQRDYTYSIDDACDIILLGTVTYWILQYTRW